MADIFSAITNSPLTDSVDHDRIWEAAMDHHESPNQIRQEWDRLEPQVTGQSPNSWPLLDFATGWSNSHVGDSSAVTFCFWKLNVV